MTPQRIDTDGYIWRALRVRPSLPASPAEFIVVDELREMGLNAYCPRGARWLIWESHHKRARPRTVREFPVFSRYVFCGLRDGEVVRRDSRRGIQGVLESGGRQLSIPPAAIRFLNDRELAGEWDSTQSWREKSPFKPGDEVTIGGDGPLAGFTGTVNLLSSEYAIKILVDAFGRKTEITIEACQLILNCAKGRNVDMRRPRIA